MNKFRKGFTLVELLVVMGILGVLVSLVAGNFRFSQIRGRDTQRKSDLKQIANALELFYSDYNQYPSSEDGYIMACYYLQGVGGNKCDWGEGEFRDVYDNLSTKTVYLKTLPKDPSSAYSYYYRTIEENQKFQIFAFLENSEDPDCLGGSGNCLSPQVDYLCGNEKACNFAITSMNTSYDE